MEQKLIDITLPRMEDKLRVETQKGKKHLWLNSWIL